MHHSSVALLVVNLSFIYSSEGDHAETRLGQDTEVLLSRKHEAPDLTLPKLETLVSEQRYLAVLFVVDVHDGNIISVDIDALVRNDQLLELVTGNILVSQHVK